MAGQTRLANAARYGGRGLSLLASGLVGVLIAEVQLAKHRVGARMSTELPPDIDGLYGDDGGSEAAPITMLLLGDSSAAGFGVHDRYDTAGGLIAAGLASISGRQVALTSFACVGARSEHLDEQISHGLEHVERPDVAVIMIGGNDVTHGVRTATSVMLLAVAVRRLRALNSEVVVGTCPDLGTIEPIAQPLRYVARRWSRQLAAAQTVAVIEAGGRTVSLGDILGPEFSARPREMFGPDRFHPSATGYASAAIAMLPSVCAALGYWPSDDDLDYQRGEAFLPIAMAAAEAAERAGSEVVGTEVGGHERGPSGRWTALRRRTASAAQTVFSAKARQADTVGATDR